MSVATLRSSASQRSLTGYADDAATEKTGSAITALLLEGVVLEGWEGFSVPEALAAMFKTGFADSAHAVTSFLHNVLSPQEAEEMLKRENSRHA